MSREREGESKRERGRKSERESKRETEHTTAPAGTTALAGGGEALGTPAGGALGAFGASPPSNVGVPNMLDARGGRLREAWVGPEEAAGVLAGARSLLMGLL